MSNLQVVPASQVQKVHMRVPMYCVGCERKIRKSLSRFKVDVDFKQQKVTVIGFINRDQVLAAIKAKRKNTQFWSSEDGKEEFGMSGARKCEIMEDVKKPAAPSKKKKRVTFADQQ